MTRLFNRINLTKIDLLDVITKTPHEKNYIFALYT